MVTPASTTVGLLHPGDMGAAVGALLAARGVRTLWVSEGRGVATRRRAREAGLVEVPRLEDLAECGVVLSVCPPAFAAEVAAAVAQTPFQGVYLDANAISPRHTRQIDELFRRRGGVKVVDGGIVGPPPRQEGVTRLYLSGAVASQMEALFADTFLQPIVLDGPVGQASALKLAFASYNKLTFALAAQSYALAEQHGVGDELRELAGAKLAGTPLGQPAGIVSAGRKAWRWEGEMAEIAAACADNGLPPGLLAAAEALFARWQDYRDDPQVTVEQLLASLKDS
jgi:3-hydroxyisobutyrate dehydrogenase-like beta-hydroxyacid dehydrogenase